MERKNVHEALLKLHSWVEKAEWKAYDTFDGLSSPYARYLTFNRPFLKQVWQQSVRRFPINLRPLLQIKPNVSSKAMGFFAQGYLRLYQNYKDPRYLNNATYCLQWLLDNRSPRFRGACWGNHFDYQHRAGSIPKGLPTIVWTGLIGHAFADAYEALADDRYLEVALSVCDFIKNELGHTDIGDSTYLSYYPGATHFVHNSNVIGASILARMNRHSPNEGYLQLGERAMRWTMQQQLPNGSWYYGAGPNFAWVDSFHTGYVLEATDIFIRYSNTKEYEPNLEKGFTFFINTFFDADGAPRYYSNKRSPLDIQCSSQGIQTLVNLRRMHPRSLELAAKVADWTIKNMQDPSGYFYYRKYPFIINRTATMHWGQATMFAALALLDQVARDASNHSD